MITLDQQRDDLAKAHRDEAFKNNPRGYSVMPGLNEPDTDFELGFDAASAIWRESVKELVEALEFPASFIKFTSMGEDNSFLPGSRAEQMQKEMLETQQKCQSALESFRRKCGL